MRPSLIRRLVVLPLLITGVLALSGKAAASEPYLFSLKGLSEETALLPAEPFEPSASGTYRAIEVELGLVPPPVKQGADGDSSVVEGAMDPPRYDGRLPADGEPAPPALAGRPGVAGHGVARAQGHASVRDP